MKKLFFTAICIISGSILSAQVGINTSTPNPDAVLDVVSANKGFLPPRIALTSTSSPSPLSTHVAGMVVYNTLTTGDVVPALYYNDGSKWILLGNPPLADVRFIGTNNHISQDAGVGSNGTSVGTGTNNIAIGQQSLSSNTVGFNNVAIGQQALGANTQGGHNIALGNQALSANITAFNNVAIGDRALTSNTTGALNIAIGNQALSNNTAAFDNLAIGVSALSQNITGTNNVAVGNYSMAANLGSDNTAIGKYAILGNTTGLQNTAIGSSAGQNLKQGDNNIFIGYNVQPNISNTGSNQLNIGNWIYGDNGKIGIATPTPQATLDVVGKPLVPGVLDGIIAPRITGNQLSPKVYTAAQTGALIYATSADTTPSGQTVNVTSSGYYYFDGAVWVKFNSGLGSGVISNTLVRSGNQMTSTITTPSGTFQGSSDIVAYNMSFNNTTRTLTLTINGQTSSVTIP
ncbi:hypothetical protein HHL23_16130 [Chryseobacterium sp. RP-3-3]|uniref:Trimeric autotransporter adhesin YadA-like head domain-containing protein n=1 Tax=Chryseobacterium antibioticum TaxID=2728847 RepID=A0A7Y0APY5_9FLAO|nr:hypothetical protein [Chryseobacterium antibioticum]NML71319.1 hypothetical protein [Chryseobacterium antibioticum]